MWGKWEEKKTNLCWQVTHVPMLNLYTRIYCVSSKFIHHTIYGICIVDRRHSVICVCVCVEELKNILCWNFVKISFWCDYVRHGKYCAHHYRNIQNFYTKFLQKSSLKKSIVQSFFMTYIKHIMCQTPKHMYTVFLWVINLILIDIFFMYTNTNTWVTYVSCTYITSKILYV